MPSGERLIDPMEAAVANWLAMGWEDSAGGMAFVTSVTRAQQILETSIDRTLRPFGLTFARFELLRLLAFTRRGTLPMGVAGQRLQVHPASVTNAVDRLERAGLVARHRSDVDGRMVIVGITNDGRELVERATVELNNLFARIPVGSNDMAQVVDALRVFRGAHDGTGTEVCR